MVWWPTRPVYVLVGVDFTAAKHVLGLCIGKAGERAKYLGEPELRSRGVDPACFVCTPTSWRTCLRRFPSSGRTRSSRPACAID